MSTSGQLAQADLLAALPLDHQARSAPGRASPAANAIRVVGERRVVTRPHLVAHLRCRPAPGSTNRLLRSGYPWITSRNRHQIFGIGCSPVGSPVLATTMR